MISRSTHPHASRLVTPLLSTGKKVVARAFAQHTPRPNAIFRAADAEAGTTYDRDYDRKVRRGPLTTSEVVRTVVACSSPAP